MARRFLGLFPRVPSAALVAYLEYRTRHSPFWLRALSWGLPLAVIGLFSWQVPY